MEDAGTSAASPRARSIHDAETIEQSVPATPSMGDVLDRASRRRMRVFHGFGIVAPLLAVLISLRLGGDPLLHQLFGAGMCVLALSNVCMLVVLRGSTSEETPMAIVLWVMGGLGTLPSILYFGPFSGVVLINLLAITIVAVGRRGVISRFVMTTAIGSHLAMTLPMIAGWTTDRGLLSGSVLDGTQSLIVELMLISLMLSGYGIGRWVRYTSADALRELENARRELGDQKQALAEINLDVARANRWNEGRWTGQTLGGWKLGYVLGRGAMGEVYEASGADGREAALKLLAPRGDVTDELVRRFHRELQVVAHLESPFIVRVFEISPPDAQVPYLVMERLRGFDLASQLRRTSRLPLDTVIIMLQQVARGLEVARVANVVHRDLKPHNLFCHDGRWMILDFGVAKVVGSEGTLTGDQIVGTPQYMAPEQATDATGSGVTHLSDVYALGAIAYRCLTGRTPFGGNDLAALVYQVVHEAPPRPSSFVALPRGVEDVLAVAMAKDPMRRFHSGLQFAESLAGAARSSVTLATPANAWS